MENRWSDDRAAQFIENYGKRWNEDFALELYLASLIGAEDNLVLHGGGNASVKTTSDGILGNSIRTIFVKASGYNMAFIEPNGYTRLDLDYLERLRAMTELSDEDMANEFRTHSLDSRSAAPSIETLIHVFIPKKFITHTHSDAILALTNQIDGGRIVKEALGNSVIVLPYYPPGFKLAKAAAAAFEQNAGAKAIVLMRHGLLTWGDTARESYDTTITLAACAENYLKQKTQVSIKPQVVTPVSLAEERFIKIAPIVRGLLANKTGDPDRPWTKSILQHLCNRSVLDLVDSDRGQEIAITPPLTSDHLIRTKPLALWIGEPNYGDLNMLRAQFSKAIQDYAISYDAYVARHASAMPAGAERMDSLPRVILAPGLGAICAAKDAAAARIVSDITAHTLDVKARIAATGVYSGMDEKDLFDMEHRPIQQAKLHGEKPLPLSRQVALVTGAAGAIGSGIAQVLLEQGCHVALTDLASANLSGLVNELAAEFGSRVLGATLDITDPQSVSAGFGKVIQAWGGIDLIVLNAGAAHVSALSDINLETFRKLEQINVEGMLIMLSESACHFKLQGTGGDIVLVSTKNVFAPGAKFGAYSATKAAGHQLARIASQEFAELDVRVNMVSPDAVFSHGARQSGLWAAIGPDRMNARGLSPEGLEEYYRNRNLLKAKITARHVGNAVLFFATRQTPTTGATIPVDGGLPDATPR